MQARFSTTTLLAGTALLALAQGALADGASIDPQDFAQKFSTAYSSSGLVIGYDEARAEGEDIILSGVTINPPDEEPVEVPGAVTFSGVTTTDDGGYRAETATIEDLSFDDDDVTVTIANLSIEGVYLPAESPAATASIESVLLYDRASFGPMTVTDNGNEVFSIESVVSYVDASDDLSEITSGYELTGMRSDLSQYEEPEVQDAIDTLGMEVIEASMSGEGTWWPETGEVEVSQIAFDVTDLARLEMTATLGGYTREVYQDMMKTQQKINDAGMDMDDAEMEAYQNAMMASLADMTLSRASLRYTDNSLFNKALTLAGEEQGVDGATFAQGLKFMVPMFLADVPNEAFVASVTEAVNSFIDEPQSISITVAPDTPVGIDALMAAKDDPMSLIDTLGLSVDANQQ